MKQSEFDKIGLGECVESLNQAKLVCLRQWSLQLERLVEDGYSDQRIKDAVARIEDLRRETARQRELIRNIRDRDRRREYLARERKRKEAEAKKRENMRHNER